MRELRFRLWDVSYNKMIYPKAGNVELYLKLNGEVVYPINDYSCMAIDTDKQFIKMQGAGFKDLNGKEIYEGDIVVYQGGTDFEYKAVVQWVNGGLAFMREDKLYPGYLPFFWNESTDNEIVEVIGNIWENPELLKEVQNE